MKILKFIPIALLFVLFQVSEASAQKIGHLNSQALMVELPATQAATKKLEAFTSQKEKELEVKGKAITDFYVKTMQDIQDGKLSPMQQQQAELDLQRKQQDLQQAELKAQQAILQKQEELFQPIVDKVNGAIEKVGKANGYDYIFDSSAGIFIHAQESDDVSSLVKRELGL